ncbi:reverse transcriptase domain-containing protein [Tanacetum coccineum]
MADQDTPPPTITAMKIPIIKKGEYDIWNLEDEATPSGEQSSPLAPKTVKQLAARRNQERIKRILLLAIPDEYLLKFHNVPDAKSLWAAIKYKFGGGHSSEVTEFVTCDPGGPFHSTYCPSDGGGGTDNLRVTWASVDGCLRSARATSQNGLIAYPGTGVRRMNALFGSDPSRLHLKCQPYSSRVHTEGLSGVDMTQWTVIMMIAYAMTWIDLKKKMTTKYCPRNEIKKIEAELWNLKVKGTDVVAYNQRFQELALLCDRMFPEETDKIERYVGGMPDLIYSSVVASKPKKCSVGTKPLVPSVLHTVTGPCIPGMQSAMTLGHLAKGMPLQEGLPLVEEQEPGKCCVVVPILALHEGSEVVYRICDVRSRVCGCIDAIGKVISYAYASIQDPMRRTILLYDLELRSSSVRSEKFGGPLSVGSSVRC